MQLFQALVGETPVEEIVTMARALATKLRGEPLEFVEVRRTTSGDLNGSAALFDAAWRAPGVDLSARIENGGGNPRDGWGYDIAVSLRVEPGGTLAEAVEMQIRDGSSTPGVWSATLRFTCTTLAVFERACGIVRDALPGRRDETDTPRWAALNAEPLLRDGNENDARTLVERCWVREGSRPHATDDKADWSRFLALRARLFPQTPASRGSRLLDDPGALDEWASIARGEVTAAGFARNTANWCTALLSPFQPTSLALLSDEHRAVREPLRRFRRAVASVLATPAWFPTTPEELTASRADAWAAWRESDDGGDGSWFRVSDSISDPIDAGSIGLAAKTGLVLGSPLERSGGPAHRVDGTLSTAPPEGHGTLRLALEPHPGAFRAEWSAAWAKPPAGDEIPALWVDLCWLVNTGNTLYRWHWLWTGAPVQGVVFVETKRARAGAPQIEIPADHPLWGDTGWLRGETFARIIGSAAWRDRVITTLAGLSFSGLRCEPVDASCVRW